jgi:hypothetical protein
LQGSRIVIVSEANAQAAEATKAAADAANTVLQNQVYGPAVIFLLIALGIVFWRLLAAHEKIAKLTELVAGGLEANKNATLAHTAALERMQTAQATAALALQEQSHETAKEISETRHAVANHHAGINAVVDMLVRRERRQA